MEGATRVGAQVASRELQAVEAKLAARNTSVDNIGASLASLRRLVDMYDELQEVSERRRLVEACLARVVGGDASIEIHRLAQPTMVVRRQGGEAAPSDPSSGELAGAGIRPC